MRRFALALAGLLFLPLAAKADTIQVTLSGSTSGYTGSGVLTATGNGNGSYTVTSITGAGITGLIAAFDPTYGYGNNNLFYPTQAGLFDNDGIAFYGSFGSANLFLASLASGYEAQGYDPDGNFFDVPVSIRITNSIAATPEPGSLLLTLTGLAGGAAAAFRRRLV